MELYPLLHNGATPEIIKPFLEQKWGVPGKSSYFHVYCDGLIEPNMDIIKFFIDMNMDVNSRNNIGTCLDVYTYDNPHCDIRVISALINAKCDINSKSWGITTSLNAYLFNTYPLNLNIVRLFLDSKSDVNNQRMGRTYIHYATAGRSSGKLIKLLLNYDCKMNKNDMKRLMPNHTDGTLLLLIFKTLNLMSRYIIYKILNYYFNDEVYINF